MQTRSSLYSGILLTIFSLGACREKRPKHDYPNDFCPVANVTLPETDSAFIVVPNAFTPNGDGLNDSWRPVFNNISSLEMKVIDAAGNILFASDQLNEGWEPMNNTQTGITRYMAWVKATSSFGNVMEQCNYICLLLFSTRRTCRYEHFNFSRPDRSELPGKLFAYPGEPGFL